MNESGKNIRKGSVEFKDDLVKVVYGGIGQWRLMGICQWRLR